MKKLTRDLLHKERTLAASPITKFFPLFGLMTLIPGYPILMGAMFVCLGIFYSFQNVRETGDILYTALLPVPKGDVVRAKYLFTLFFQGLGFALMAVLTALRMTVLSRAAVYTSNVMMPANPVFLGFVLLIYTAFNTLFLGGFFRSAWSIGWPFLRFAVTALFLTAIGEALHHFPGLEFLSGDFPEDLAAQFVILLLCAGVFALVTRSGYKRARARFEALDL